MNDSSTYLLWNYVLLVFPILLWHIQTWNFLSLTTGMQVIIVTKYIHIHNTVPLTFCQHAIDLFIEFIGKEVWLLFCMFAFEMRAFEGREREREREWIRRDSIDEYKDRNRNEARKINEFSFLVLKVQYII